MEKPASDSQSQHSDDSGISSCHKSSRAKLTVLPLVFLIFYEVSGGPIGTEEAVQAGGPFLALLGFLLFPFIWSIPEALLTAEMATSYPVNGGYVVWTSAAFGPFWGFLQGWWKWVSGVVNNATYPVLCLDYVKAVFPWVVTGSPRVAGIFIITGSLTYLNYRGLSIVGWSAVCLGIISLLPFLIMAILAIPRLKPERWFVLDIHDISWRPYLNTLFWNLNFWDNASTLAGEVEDPQRAFPKALFAAGILVGLCYIIPLLAGIGAFRVERSIWSDGYYAVLAGQLGGMWLKLWMELGAFLSCVGLFAAQMSSSSFQILGMAETGILPSVAGYRSSYNTPILGILLSAFGALLLSFMSFQEIIEAANALYSCGMLLEFAAFVWLRKKDPDRIRPFKVPFDFVGIILMCVLPCVLLIFVMTFSSLKVIIATCMATLVGLLLYICLGCSKRNKWIKFVIIESVGHQVEKSTGARCDEEGEVEALLHSE